MEKGEIAQNEQFHFFSVMFSVQSVYQNIAICISKSFNSHMSIIACSFFEFGMVSKWYLGNGLKRLVKEINDKIVDSVDS